MTASLIASLKAGVNTLLILSKEILPQDGCLVIGAPAISTTLAQEGAGLEIGWLPGRESVPTSLHVRPVTPVAGEAGGELLQHTSSTTINPRRGRGV
jgi:hypothetical protein